MKPTIGDAVVVYGLNTNGTREHPGMVSRVWEPSKDTKDGSVLVNVIWFPDGGGESQFTAHLQLFDSRAQAEKLAPGKSVAYWP